MPLTATKLRANIYAILDQILATGEAVEIERNGRLLRLQPVEVGSRLDRLVSRPGTIIGDPEDLVEFDWTHEWSELGPHALIPMPSSGPMQVRPPDSAKKRKRK